MDAWDGESLASEVPERARREYETCVGRGYTDDECVGTWGDDGSMSMDKGCRVVGCDELPVVEASVIISCVTDVANNALQHNQFSS